MPAFSASIRRPFANTTRSELDLGHVKANVRVAENLFRKATGEGREAVIAAIFWMKTRAGWREVNTHEVTAHETITRIQRIIVEPDGSRHPLTIDHE